MRKFILIFFLGFYSCEDEAPAQLPFSEKKAIKIITDIQVAEAAFQFANKNSKDSIATLYYDEVFKMNNITKEEFDNLLKILIDNPGIADTLYEKVLLELDKEERISNPRGNKSPVELR